MDFFFFVRRAARFSAGPSSMGCAAALGFWPAAIFCMNRGVYALTRQSFASVHLAELAEAGVSVLACGTCVDHYDVRDELTAGEVSGMAVFVDLAAKHDVLTIA